MFDEITAPNLINVTMQCRVPNASHFSAGPAGFMIHGAVPEAVWGAAHPYTRHIQIDVQVEVRVEYGDTTDRERRAPGHTPED